MDWLLWDGEAQVAGYSGTEAQWAGYSGTERPNGLVIMGRRG